LIQIKNLISIKVLLFFGYVDKISFA